MSRRPPYRHPAFFERPAHRLRLIAALQAVGVPVTTVTPGHPRRQGFAVRILLTPTGLPRHPVVIQFGIDVPDTPMVLVPGPGSPHRYHDGSLCMWYPHDPPAQRWTWTDGGAVLAGHISAHLIREAWWRQTGEWPGEEAPHDEPPARHGDQAA